MSVLTITIDSENLDNCQFSINKDDGRDYKIASVIAKMVLENKDMKVYLIGGITLAAESDPFIARNIMHDIIEHQMHRLISSRQAI